MSKISKSKSARKPSKPTEDFPLFAHASGQWAKKVKGHMRYFGVWSDPDAALREYERQRRHLERGETPPNRCTIADLVFGFLEEKETRMKNGELSPRTFKDYVRVSENIVKAFGEDQVVSNLEPSDFIRLRKNMAKTLNHQSLGNEINRVKILFRYGSKNGMCPEVVFGSQFKRPEKHVIRAERKRKQREHGKRMLEANEIRMILDALSGKPVFVEGQDEPVKLASDPVLKAMVLLACNAGFGQSDLACMPISSINFETGWLDFERPKTAIDRRCPLWSETLQAVREALAVRPKAKSPSDDGLLFLTRFGRRWVKATLRSNGDELGKSFSKLLVKLGLKRPGLSFYSLRHGFQTVGGHSKDREAVSSIMGHADGSMGALYNEEGIADARLQAVVDHVREWLFVEPGTKGEAAA